MDRIDMHIDVGRVPVGSVLDAGSGTSSERLRDGVLAAREFRSWRQSRVGAAQSGGAPSDMVSACLLDDEDMAFYRRACKANQMSGRALLRTLSVARTIADIAERERVNKSDLCEALNYRTREGGA